MTFEKHHLFKGSQQKVVHKISNANNKKIRDKVVDAHCQLVGDVV